MRKYIKWLTYHIISVIESSFKLIFALFGYYPPLDFSGEFLIMGECARVSNEISRTEKRRSEGMAKYQEMRSEAYDGEV